MRKQTHREAAAKRGQARREAAEVRKEARREAAEVRKEARREAAEARKKARREASKGRKWLRRLRNLLLLGILFCLIAHTAVVVRGSSRILDLGLSDGEILSGLPEEKADCNKLVGKVVISARNLRMDLPVGSDVEVTFAAKEPGSIDVTVYIPLLDLDADVRLDMTANAPDKAFLATEVEKERARVGALSAKGVSLGSAAALVDDAEKAVANATDPESRQQAFTLIREARKALDGAEDVAAWPNKEEETENSIVYTD